MPEKFQPDPVRSVLMLAMASLKETGSTMIDAFAPNELF